MREVAELLNEMKDAGVILDYALFGAGAQMRYTEPVATLNADILISVPNPDQLDVLRPIYEFCSRKGFRAQGEAIRVGAWPVQFVPVFSTLTREALEQAETADFEGVPFRVVGPVHLAVIALSVGRPKDFIRILALLESGSVDQQAIATDVQELFRRQAAWQKEQRSLTWAEKIRMAEAVRESILALRASTKDSKSPNHNSIS